MHALARLSRPAFPAPAGMNRPQHDQPIGLDRVPRARGDEPAKDRAVAMRD